VGELKEEYSSVVMGLNTKELGSSARKNEFHQRRHGE